MSGLFSALGNSFTGLNTAQRSIDVAARNVANASTPGYSTKTLPIDNHVLGGEGRGVMSGAVQRDVDQRMLQQLRVDTARAAHTGVVSDYMSRIDQMFGRPQDEGTIGAQIDRMTGALQKLATNPESSAMRAAVLDQADATADQLNSLADQVQTMRGEAEAAIDAAVRQVNDDLSAVGRLNEQIAQRASQGQSYADLADQRDQYLEDVAEQMEIRVIDGGEGRALVFTPDGNSLVGRGGARPLQFDRHHEINATTRWSSDDSLRQVGTITLGAEGNRVDLIQSGSLTGGRIAGLVEMRDEVLPQAQAQLDELAHQTATALSERSVEATRAAPDNTLDVGGLIQSPGDRVEITIDSSGTKANYSFIASADPAGPHAANPTARPGDQVRYFELGADDSATAQNLRNALIAEFGGPNVDPPGPQPTKVTLQDPGTQTVDSMTGRASRTELTSSEYPPALGLPVFSDMKTGQVDYTGSLDGVGQKLGFANRIALNQELADTPERLVLPNDTTPVGDPARPMALTTRLAEQTVTFSPATGIGGQSQPHKGTLGGFAREIVSFQGNRAATAESRAGEADAVARAVQDRVDNANGVNIDQEMNRLMEMEKVYAANAKMMGIVDQMFDQLFAIKR